MKYTITLCAAIALFASFAVLGGCRAFRSTKAVIYEKTTTRQGQKNETEIAFVFKTRKDATLAPVLQTEDKSIPTFKIVSILNEKNVLFSIGKTLPPGTYRIKATTESPFQPKPDLVFLFTANEKTIKVKPAVGKPLLRK